MTNLNRTIGQLAEDELLARIIPQLPAGRTVIDNGDDAAVLPADDGSVVACTDVMVEDRHFRTAWSTGGDIGWRVAMQNLSDISAMGAAGTQLLIGLVMPPSTTLAWVEDFARGLRQACEAGAFAWGSPVGVAGGDLSGGEKIMVSVTALGSLCGRKPLTRAGARPGDTVAVAGTLGFSAAGLALATAGKIPARLADDWQDLSESGASADQWAQYAWHIYRRPQPPLTAGVSAADVGASAAMDISDGLVRDLGRLARASGVSIELTPPCDLPGLVSIAESLAPSEGKALANSWWHSGGEDHALLATFHSGTELPDGFTAIGRVLQDCEGGALTGIDPEAARGWDHFGQG
ncbi:thiamine-phosphate kinase [Bowdeniella nasicola]|uniref:Thiamine-monophosphate kinase n=1 Tax=Bowdeniella nasicola TaxID=208480 RepID=A0A1Q5Q4M4_9ACTO|nr:thiamine-phosphate kinase [Bowdeniella nasicola]OKL54652.1 thiamine-phosphate kinase [Bowdeniella nasicola]